MRERARHEGAGHSGELRKGLGWLPAGEGRAAESGWPNIDGRAECYMSTRMQREAYEGFQVGKLMDQINYLKAREENRKMS